MGSAIQKIISKSFGTRCSCPTVHLGQKDLESLPEIPSTVNLCCVPATERGVDSFQASFVYDEVQPTTEGFRGTALWTLGLWFMFSLCFSLFSLHCWQWSRHQMDVAPKIMHSTLQRRWERRSGRHKSIVNTAVTKVKHWQWQHSSTLESDPRGRRDLPEDDSPSSNHGEEKFRLLPLQIHRLIVDYWTYSGSGKAHCLPCPLKALTY